MLSRAMRGACLPLALVLRFQLLHPDFGFCASFGPLFDERFQFIHLSIAAYACTCFRTCACACMSLHARGRGRAGHGTVVLARANSLRSCSQLSAVCFERLILSVSSSTSTCLLFSCAVTSCSSCSSISSFRSRSCTTDTCAKMYVCVPSLRVFAHARAHAHMHVNTC